MTCMLERGGRRPAGVSPRSMKSSEKRIEEGPHTEAKGYIGERHDDGEPEKAMGWGPIARRTGSSI
jgi:hypothetical protein